jgi:hypothetical protein
MYLQNCQIIVKNERICKFYKRNIQIDIEKVNLQIIDIFEDLLQKTNIYETPEICIGNIGEPVSNRTIESSERYTVRDQYSAAGEIGFNFNKYQNESTNEKEFIGKLYDIIHLFKKDIASSQNIHESNIYILLNKIYSNGDISIVHCPTLMFSRTLFKTSCDNNFQRNHEDQQYGNEECILNTNELYIIKRPNKYNILVKNRDIKINILNEEVNDFIQLMEENNCHGVFLSQNSGFSLKPDFHIEIYNKLIIVYVHNVNYDENKIKMAINIIDNLAIKLRELQSKESIYEVIIDKDTLEEINKEYQMFVQQKDILINIFKENQKQFFLQMEEFKFPELNKYLSTKFSIPMNKQGFKCDLCKKFNGNNLKALAAHKRGCMRKIKGCTTASFSVENRKIEVEVDSPNNLHTRYSKFPAQVMDPVSVKPLNNK